MIHVLDYCFDQDINLTSYIDCLQVYKYIRMKKLDYYEVEVSSIIHKDISGILETDPRYVFANIELPVILIDGLSQKHRMIDGRHRLMKHIHLKKSTIKSYIITSQEAYKFIKLY